MPNWKAYLATLVITIVAGTAAFLFLPIFGTTAKRGLQTMNLSNAKQLGLGVKLYPPDHDGRFPVHLSELMPDYIPADSLDQLLYRAKIGDENQPRLKYDWLYFGAFFDEKQPPPLLIASPFAFKDGEKQKRVVIRGDLTGQIINDDEYQEELRKTIEAMNNRAGSPMLSLPGSDAPKPQRVESEAPNE